MLSSNLTQKLALGAIVLGMLSSCSVVMAARKEGVNIEKIQNSRTRGQLISCGVTVISSEKSYSGELVEVYQIQKERGSAARALMHGALDVGTCGLWEVIGTPIEACDTKEYFVIKVFYDLNENIKKIELL
jgi:hypothetical protein